MYMLIIKISGILINNVVKGRIINSSVIGIGINVNQTILIKNTLPLL